MRKLWEEHIGYTRNLIISRLANLPDLLTVLARLQRNQDDIGHAFKTFYGEEFAQKLAALLHDHISIAVAVVNAAIAGDTATFNAQYALWRANASAIAKLLADANPKYDRAMLDEMLQKHLDLTAGEVSARLSANWTADIAAYDAGHTHMLKFSDVLADGIIEQFEKKFRKSDKHFHFDLGPVA
jgi:hypothetical protein